MPQMTLVQPDESLEQDVLEQLHSLLIQVRLLIPYAVDGERPVLAPMQARALGYIARHGPCTVQSLALNFGRDKGQISRLIGQLEDRGLIERSPDLRDRRSQLIRSTAEGLAAHALTAGQRDELSRILTDGFSTDEQTDMVDYLARMRQNIAELWDRSRGPAIDDGEL